MKAETKGEEAKSAPATEAVASKEEKYEELFAAAKKHVKLDPALVLNAVEGLKAFAEEKKKTAKNLLEDEDDFMHVTITLSSVPMKFSPRPEQIQLKHPIYGSKYLTHVCLFVKDPQRKFKDLVEDLEVPCLGKIIGYNKMLKSFKEYKDRRQLINEFDLFFCDKSLYSMMPKVTGSFFYRKKKFPFPLKLSEDGGEVKQIMTEALKCSYLTLGNGPHYSFKVARVSMKPKTCVANVMDAVYKAIPHVIRDVAGPEKIQCITLKTSTSPELPIYNYMGKEDAMAYLEGSQEPKESAK